MRPGSAAGAGAGASGGVLHAGSYQQPPAGAKDVVHDLSHKAAKALQSGTKWFMRASKTLVSQVQHRLEHSAGGAAAGPGGAHGGGGSGGGSVAARPGAVGWVERGRLGAACLLGLYYRLAAVQPRAAPCAADPPALLLPLPAGRPRPAAGPGEPAPFHYDWAAQLARVSPNSRAAALGAMTEDDRLSVQVRAAV